MICRNCGYQVHDVTLELCPRCGLRLGFALPQSMATTSDTQQTAPLWRESARTAMPPAAEPPAPKKRSKRVLWGVIALVLVAVAGLGAGGIFYAHGRTGAPDGNAKLAATATATDMPTATPLPTATPKPTATPRPKPTATPAPQLVTILNDPLTASSHSSGWYTDGANAFFQSDGYHIRNGYECYAPVSKQADFNVSVQMKITASSSASYGIVFRAADTSGLKEYQFYISSTGLFVVFDKSLGYLIQPTPSSAIHQGAGVLNTIEVDARGSHFTFLINGTQVGSMNNSALPNGLVALGTEQSGIEVVFSNLKITKWV